MVLAKVKYICNHRHTDESLKDAWAMILTSIDLCDINEEVLSDSTLSSCSTEVQIKRHQPSIEDQISQMRLDFMQSLSTINSQILNISLTMSPFGVWQPRHH